MTQNSNTKTARSEDLVLDLASAVKPLNFSEFTDLPVNYQGGTVKETSKSNLSVFLIRSDPQTIFCLVCIDIIWVSDIFTKDLREVLSVDLKTPISNICICASHTHGSPNMDPGFLFARASQEFVNYIFDSAIEAVRSAGSSSFCPVKLCYGKEPVFGVAVNRRRKAFIFENWRLARRAQNLPNRESETNAQLRLLIFRGLLDNSIKGLLVNFACHPVSDPSNTVGADYPGFLRNKIADYYGVNIPFGFLQGFSGDIRPDLILRPSSLKNWILQLLIGSRFRLSEPNDSIRIADSLWASMLDVREETLEKRAGPNMSSTQEKIPIPMSDGTLHDRELDFTVWSMGRMKIQFLSGEILSRFSCLAKSDDPLMQVGYSNGMVGYIPSSADFSSGGYEVDGSRKKFRMNSRVCRNFSNELEKRIKLVLGLPI